MATQTKEQEIIETEQKFWNAMQKKDGAAASRLTGDKCIVVGAQGVAAIDSASMGKMTKEGKWELKKFTFDDKSRQIHFITDDIAVVGYTVSEDIVYEGQALKFDAHDSSVWVRRDGEWRCALHTESIAGDPFGRDKQPAKKG